MPETLQVLTGGGRHLYFACTDGGRNRVGVLSGIDVRGDGGYVVAPPSIHVSGKIYAWEIAHRPDEMAAAPVPDFFRSRNGSTSAAGPLPETILEGGRNAALASLAGSMRRRGATPESLLAALRIENETRCNPPLGDDEVRQIAASVGRYAPAHAMAGADDENKPKPIQTPTGKKGGQGGRTADLSETIDLLGAQYPAGIARLDEFHQQIFHADGHEWQDTDTLRTTDSLQRAGHRVIGAIVEDAITVIAHDRATNEPLDWVRTLTWDGIPRIDHFLTACMGAETSDYANGVSRNLWLGLLARLMRPGCIMRSVVVLTGPQNIGKSRAVAAIGGKWYAETAVSVMTKDFFLALQGKLILEIAELSAFEMGKTEATRIKQAISCVSDRFRPPYGRATKDFPRRCIFVGTTNELSGYLTDHTGGTRFFPIAVGSIDVPLIVELRDQFFAEAAARITAGEPWWKMPGGSAEIQEAHRIADVWEARITDWLVGRAETTMGEILTDCLDVPAKDQDRSRQMRVSHALSALGFRVQVVWRGGRTIRVWRLCD